MKYLNHLLLLIKLRWWMLSFNFRLFKVQIAAKRFILTRKRLDDYYNKNRLIIAYHNSLEQKRY